MVNNLALVAIELVAYLAICRYVKNAIYDVWGKEIRIFFQVRHGVLQKFHAQIAVHPENSSVDIHPENTLFNAEKVDKHATIGQLNKEYKEVCNNEKNC